MEAKVMTTTTQKADSSKSDVQEKRAYSAPKLKEHGSVQEVTLQTFFGSFSP